MMMRRPSVIRKAVSVSGKEVTIPSDCALKVRQKVGVIPDSFVLVVPEDTVVNEEALGSLVEKSEDAS